MEVKELMELAAPESNGCLTLLSNTSVMVNGRSVKPARAVYEHFFGALKKGQKVRRSCNNLLCIAPGHLTTAPKIKRLWSIHVRFTQEELTEIDSYWPGQFKSREEFLRFTTLEQIREWDT